MGQICNKFFGTTLQNCYKPDFQPTGGPGGQIADYTVFFTTRITDGALIHPKQFFAFFFTFSRGHQVDGVGTGWGACNDWRGVSGRHRFCSSALLGQAEEASTSRSRTLQAHLHLRQVCHFFWKTECFWYFSCFFRRLTRFIFLKPFSHMNGFKDTCHLR